MALNNPAFNNPAFQDPTAVQDLSRRPQARLNLGGADPVRDRAARRHGCRSPGAARGHVRRPPRRRHRDRPDDGRGHRLEDRRPLRRPPRHRRRRLDLDDGRRSPRRTRARTIAPVDHRRARRLRPLARRHLHVAQEGPPRADLRLRRLRGPLRRRHLGVLRVHLAGHRRPGDARDARRSSASRSPSSRAARSARRSGPRRSS